MRFQRVLLVSPPTSSYLGGARLPSGLGYIAQSLLDWSVERFNAYSIFQVFV